MIKVEHIETFGWEAAIRGLRNPMNSWAKSDTKFGERIKKPEWNSGAPNIGENDLDLMSRLCKAGTEHRKYLRMIHVQMDVTAPLYWWKENSQYKIATTTNSCSTMHTITKKEFILDDFSHEHLTTDNEDWEDGAYSGILYLDSTIYGLNYFRNKYLETKDKKWWWQLIQLLPSSYNQKRTWDFNYETVFNILRQRSSHRLDEWCEFCEILKGLPYVKEIGGFTND